MAGGSSYPRPLSPMESAWLELLLPETHPGYARFARMLAGLGVLGEGRWGAGDLILGLPGAGIDHSDGMTPVFAYGEARMVSPDGREDTVTLSLHQPDDDGKVEFHCAGSGAGELPSESVMAAGWSYSGWTPGAPCPATGLAVRQIRLDAAGELILAIAPARRNLWLYDALPMTSTLIPVTNFYNELMLLKGIRDPKIALDHRRLFNAPEEFSDADLRAAFARYNVGFRKIAPERLAGPSPPSATSGGVIAKIMNLFRGKGE